MGLGCVERSPGERDAAARRPALVIAASILVKEQDEQEGNLLRICLSRSKDVRCTALMRSGGRAESRVSR
jgi:hypothetical protein